MCSPKKSESMINEIESFPNQGVDKSYYSQNSYYDSSHTSTPDHRNGQGDHKCIDKYYENRRSFINLNLSSENQFITEDSCSINNLSPEYSLALFVTDPVCLDDFSSSFSNKFGTNGILMDQHLHCGDVGEVLSDEKQYAFYLVLRKRSESQSLIFDFEKALNTLLGKMNKYKLTKLAIPRIELEKYFYFKDAQKCIMKVFTKSNIEVTLCTKTFRICRSVSPIVSFIPIQLWQIQSQTDLIMFINLEEMYLESWRDEVVENVNARYPFKNKLLQDTAIKSMACGDVLTYKIDCEMLFCIFFNYDNPTYFTCIEKAFKEIKSQLTGIRYLGIQHNSVNFKYRGHSLNRHLNLLRNINFHKIFICGQFDCQKNQRIQYQKTINDAIEMNKIESPKLNASTRFKTMRENLNKKLLLKYL